MSKKSIISLSAATLFIALSISTCSNNPNGTNLANDKRLSADEIWCIDVKRNATIQKIGFNSADSVLSTMYSNQLSYCTPDTERVQNNRLDISLLTLIGTYTHTKSSTVNIHDLPPGAQTLFTGTVSCSEQCDISSLFNLNGISLHIVNEFDKGKLYLRLFINGISRAEYSIW